MMIAELYIAVYNIIIRLHAYKHLGHYLGSARAVTMLCMLIITIYHIYSECQHMPQSDNYIVMSLIWIVCSSFL